MNCSSEAVDAIDGETRARLEKATGSEEITAILDEKSVRWRQRSPCLRHPLQTGCPWPMQCDIDSKTHI